MSKLPEFDFDIKELDLLEVNLQPLEVELQPIEVTLETLTIELPNWEDLKIEPIPILKLDNLDSIDLSKLDISKE